MKNMLLHLTSLNLIFVQYLASECKNLQAPNRVTVPECIAFRDSSEERGL
jgi:hypothetical protein